MRTLSVAMALLHLTSFPGSLRADPLPFRDGVYLSTPDLCGLSIAEITDRIGDEVHYVYQEIDGASFRGAETLCEIGEVAVTGNQVTFQASCAVEGMVNRDTIELKYLSDTAFQSGDAVFQRCE